MSFQGIFHAAYLVQADFSQMAPVATTAPLRTSALGRNVDTLLAPCVCYHPVDDTSVGVLAPASEFFVLPAFWASPRFLTITSYI